MREKDFKINKKKKIATASMAVFGVTLVVGGAFAALSDTLSHDESVVIEWVDIVDNSSANLALEDVSDVTNTPVEELTPGITYELTGVLENDSTVITDWVATDLTTTQGMTVTIADADGADTPSAIGEAVDVSQFGITVQVDQSVTPSTGLNFEIQFSSSDARVMLSEPTAISTVFPDPALAACVANDGESGANGDVNYLIDQNDLSNIDNLSCSSLGITNIEGLQYMHNLSHLALWNNDITDISPIANLTKIKTLNLDSNNITDISALTNLTNLETLYLGGNNIEDISSLTNMQNLNILEIHKNEITDFSALTYQPVTFRANDNAIVLPDTTLGTPTPVVIDGINGEDLIITFNTPGTYENGELTWENPGVNSLTYASSDGTITGTITQQVN